MQSEQQTMSRLEFIRLGLKRISVIILISAALWAVVAVVTALFNPDRRYEVALLAFLLLIIAQPLLNTSIGKQLIRKLPPIVRQLATILKIVSLLISSLLLILIGLSMPVVIIVYCIILVIQNARLQMKLDTQTPIPPNAS